MGFRSEKANIQKEKKKKEWMKSVLMDWILLKSKSVSFLIYLDRKEDQSPNVIQPFLQ